MKIPNSRSLISIALPAVISVIFGILSSACKPSETHSNSEETESSDSEISRLQQQAQEVIENDPHVEIVKVVGEQLHIQNKYTKRSLTLPFQMVIDGHYEIVREDEKLAASILKNQGIKAKRGQFSPISVQPKEGKSTTPSMKSEGWGKTPSWIPRYPDIKLHPTKIHTPREDGSVWGNISGTHTDPLDKARENLISEFKKSGLKLTRNLAETDRVFMIFENNDAVNDDSQERRKVTCTISKREEETRISIQYHYGM